MPPFKLTAAPVKHTLLRLADEERVRQGKSRAAVAERAGLNANLTVKWFHQGTVPSLVNFEALVEALGYKLAIVPRDHADIVRKGD